MLVQEIVDVFVLGRGPALLCVQQQRGESSGQESGGDCGCPTRQSAPSKYPPPPGSDETGQIPQTLQETEERGKKSNEVIASETTPDKFIQ